MTKRHDKIVRSVLQAASAEHIEKAAALREEKKSGKDISAKHATALGEYKEAMLGKNGVIHQTMTSLENIWVKGGKSPNEVKEMAKLEKERLWKNRKRAFNRVVSGTDKENVTPDTFDTYAIKSFMGKTKKPPNLSGKAFLDKQGVETVAAEIVKEEISKSKLTSLNKKRNLTLFDIDSHLQSLHSEISKTFDKVRRLPDKSTLKNQQGVVKFKKENRATFKKIQEYNHLTSIIREASLLRKDPYGNVVLATVRGQSKGQLKQVEKNITERSTPKKGNRGARSTGPQIQKKNKKARGSESITVRRPELLRKQTVVKVPKKKK